MKPILSLILVMTVCSLAVAEDRGPLTTPAGDALAMIAIPDLRKALTDIESAAAVIEPSLKDSGQLMAGIGMALQDPGLTLLGQGPSVVVVSSAGAQPQMVTIVPATDASALVEKVRAGFMSAEAVGNLVVVSDKPGNLPKGVELANQYASLTGDLDIKGDIMVTASGSRAMKIYGPMIQMFGGMAAMQMASEQGGGQEMGQFIALYIQALTATLGDMETLQMDLDFTDIGLDGTMRVAAVEGSDLALATKPFDAKPVDDLAAFIPGDREAVMVMAGTIDLEGTAAWMQALGTKLMANPQGGSLITQDILDTMVNTVTSLDGRLVGAAFANDVAVDSVFAYGANSDTALDTLTDYINLTMGEGSIVEKIQAASGITTTMTQSNQTIDNVEVRSFDMKVDVKDGTPNADMVKAMSEQVTHMAQIGKAIVGSQGATAKPITGPAASPLSINIEGIDAPFLVSMDIAKFAAIYGKMAAELGVDLSGAKGGTPWIIGAGNDAHGTFMEFKAPFAPIAEIRKAAEGGGADDGAAVQGF